MHRSFIITGPNVLIIAIFSIATLSRRNTTISQNWGTVMRQIRQFEFSRNITWARQLFVMAKMQVWLSRERKQHCNVLFLVLSKDNSSLFCSFHLAWHFHTSYLRFDCVKIGMLTKKPNIFCHFRQIFRLNKTECCNLSGELFETQKKT